MSSASDQTPPEGELPAAGKEKGEMRLIARAAAILRALAERPTGASLGELAKATGLARSTVQRLVDALALEGLISAGVNSASIKLGLEISRLASFVQSGPREHFRPYMEELMRLAQETVDLTILDEQGSVIVIDQLASTYSLRVVSHVGQRIPLHCSASGKAHLSQLGADERRALITPAIRRLTPNTKTDLQEILAEIEASARRGYFVDNEEYAEGVCALAIGAPSPGGGNFAIAIPIPAHRFSANREAYTQHLLELRAAMTVALGRMSFS